MKYLLGCLLLIGCAQPTQVITNVNTPSKIIYMGGVIRCYGTQDCRLIQDADHTPLNVLGARASGEWIIIDYMPVKKVISLTVTADETFVAQDIECGPSVGMERASIRCYGYKDNVYQQLYPEDLVSGSGNLWFVGLMEVE